MSNVNKLDEFLSSRRNPSGIRHLIFTGDGRTLAAVNADSTIRMWYTDARRAVADICAATRGSLTRERWQEYAAEVPYQAPCTGTPGGTAAQALPGSAATRGPAVGPTVTANAAPLPCAATGLGFAYGTAPAADTARLVITNTADRPCTLNNVPDVRVYGVADADHLASYRLRYYVVDPSPVTLAPGGQAHVDVMFAGPVDPAAKAWIPEKITITLPFAGGTLSLPWSSGKPLEPFITSSRPPTFCSAFLAGPA